MLTTRLEDVWNKADEATKKRALGYAEIILQNLTHYPMKKGRYFTDDVERLAAELLWYRSRDEANPFIQEKTNA